MRAFLPLIGGLPMTIACLFRQHLFQMAVERLPGFFRRRELVVDFAPTVLRNRKASEAAALPEQQAALVLPPPFAVLGPRGPPGTSEHPLQRVAPLLVGLDLPVPQQSVPQQQCWLHH